MKLSSNNPDIEKKDKLSKNIMTEKSYFRWIPLLISSVIFINLFATLRLSQRLGNLISNKPYIYVQKVDGEIAVAEPKDALHREDKVIELFATDWMKLAFTWQSDDSDSSVTQNGINYPSSLHFASLAILPEYREAYLPAVNERYSTQFRFRDYISGKNQTYVSIFEKPIVEKVSPGVWDVTVIANRSHASGKSIFAEEPFNHVLRVRAIEPQDLNKSKKLDIEQDTILYQMIKSMESKGLQITKISVF